MTAGRLFSTLLLLLLLLLPKAGLKRSPVTIHRHQPLQPLKIP
jgi:hypothetical protein